jgi:hypothetical protein
MSVADFTAGQALSVRIDTDKTGKMLERIRKERVGTIGISH